MWKKVPNPVRPSQSAKKSLIFYIYPYFLHFNDVTAILGNCRRFGWDAIWMFSERLYVYIYIYICVLFKRLPPAFHRRAGFAGRYAPFPLSSAGRPDHPDGRRPTACRR